jgi:hypothetical protein
LNLTLCLRQAGKDAKAQRMKEEREDVAAEVLAGC